MFCFSFLLIIYSTSELQTPLLKSLIQRRQLLDGTAKSGGVAPKLPGSDHVFNNNNPVSSLTQRSTIQQMLSKLSTTSTTTMRINEVAEDRSIKDTASSNSSSKSTLLASILAPTGILGLIGTAVGFFLYRKNQTNSSTNENLGFLSQFFNRNSNAMIENKLDEKYLLVGNIS